MRNMIFTIFITVLFIGCAARNVAPQTATECTPTIEAEVTPTEAAATTEDAGCHCSGSDNGDAEETGSEDGHAHEEADSCNCAEGREGGTAWCDSCGVGYIDGDRTTDRAAYDTAAPADMEDMEDMEEEATEETTEEPVTE